MGQGQTAAGGVQPIVVAAEAATSSAATASDDAKPADKKKSAWMPPGSLAVDKPHRKASNSCERIKTDMLECYERSRCYKEGAAFEECLNSNDPDWVTSEC